MEFSRQEYPSGLPFPSPEHFPDPGIEPRSPALQSEEQKEIPFEATRGYFWLKNPKIRKGTDGSTEYPWKREELRLKDDVSKSCSVTSKSLRPHGLYSPWNFPDQNTGVGSLSLLQGMFPTQGSNPGLPHCRWILYQLSHKGSPMIRQKMIREGNTVNPAVLMPERLSSETWLVWASWWKLAGSMAYSAFGKHPALKIWIRTPAYKGTILYFPKWISSSGGITVRITL